MAVIIRRIITFDVLQGTTYFVPWPIVNLKRQRQYANLNNLICYLSEYHVLTNLNNSANSFYADTLLQRGLIIPQPQPQPWHVKQQRQNELPFYLDDI